MLINHLLQKNREFLKTSNWNKSETPCKIHMHVMVTINTIVFEIVGGGGAINANHLHPPPPPPQIVNFFKYPGLGRVKSMGAHINFRRGVQALKGFSYRTKKNRPPPYIKKKLVKRPSK